MELSDARAQKSGKGQIGGAKSPIFGYRHHASTFFPGTVPSPRNNPHPRSQRLEDVEMLRAFQECFRGRADEVNYVEFKAEYEGQDIVRTTTIQRSGAVQQISQPTAIRRGMTERVSDRRRRTMRAVKAKNTAPELIVRRILHAAGYRYRLHDKRLPGKPDLVFPSRRKVIFVHGCFWHGHGCKRGNRLPKRNAAYWRDKIKRNQRRDRVQLVALREAGWRSLVLWECELRGY